ncbi:MAG: hypothetical protein H7138_07235, partial [Myxococcales bacterium]|nr:hypothetical protein [Myxococcales bacterium]
SVVAVTLRGGKLTALGPVAFARNEPRLPTVLRLWVNRDFVPTERTRQTITRTPTRRAATTLKICHDDEGRVSSRRVVHASGLAAFDAETLTHFATIDQLEPYQPRGIPAPACSILVVRYPDALGGLRE